MYFAESYFSQLMKLAKAEINRQDFSIPFSTVADISQNFKT
jgi:hypothetical protein